MDSLSALQIDCHILGSTMNDTSALSAMFHMLLTINASQFYGGIIGKVYAKETYLSSKSETKELSSKSHLKRNKGTHELVSNIYGHIIHVLYVIV